jgi:hypothetical protein
MSEAPNARLFATQNPFTLSLVGLRAAYMPDAAWAVSEHLPS